MSGCLMMVYLYVGLMGWNGFVVVDLLELGILFGFCGLFVFFGMIEVEDVVGLLVSGDVLFDNLLVEFVMKGIYFNIYIEWNLIGEIWG